MDRVELPANHRGTRQVLENWKSCWKPDSKLFRDGERVTLSYLVSQKYAGEKAKLSFFRDGKDMETEVQLSEPKKLIPRHISNKRPSYLVVAGIASSK